MSTGKTKYRIVTLVEAATAATVTTAPRSKPPSHVQMRRSVASGARAQTTMKGTTTSAPERSPSHHVRRKVGLCETRDHSGPQHRECAGRSADRGPERERREHAGHLLDPVELRAAADQAAHQGGADDDLRHVAELLPDERRRRQGVVADEELEVDDEVTEKDAGPPAQPPEIERCDAEAGRRRDRGDRSRVLEGLPGLRRSVVRGSEHEDARGVARPAGACTGKPVGDPTGKGFDFGVVRGRSLQPTERQAYLRSKPAPTLAECIIPPRPLRDAARTSVSDHPFWAMNARPKPHGSFEGLPIRVVLGEDSFLAREAIAGVLERAEGIELVADCSDLESLRAAIERERPDVVVVDIRMPPDHSDEGIRLAADLRSEHPEIGVVVLSQYSKPIYASLLFEEGSRRRTYLLKESLRDQGELSRALQTVAEGGSVVDPLVVERLVEASRRREDARLDTLTPREFEILGLIAQGRQGDTAIAEELFVTKRAVERHINSIFAKLDLREADDVSRRVKAALLYLSGNA